jgi:hypothetical protein
VAVTIGALVAVNRVRGRAPLQRPDTIGVPELSVFVVVPGLIPVVFSRQPGQGLEIAVGNLVLLGIVYLVTSYGLVPMMRWAGVQLVKQISNVTNLFVRSLPLLVVFTMFMFFNAELWKIADDIPMSFFAISLGLLVLVGSAFVVLRFPRELGALASFASWSEVATRTVDTPVRDVVLDGLADPPSPAGLNRRARANVALVLFTSQAFQILLVIAAITAFYVVFGAFTVVPSTVEQWTGSESIEQIARWSIGDNDVVLTWELVRTSVFVAAVAGLQFTVAALTDTTYRQEFHEELSGDIRQAFAVRAVYLARVTR